MATVGLGDESFESNSVDVELLENMSPPAPQTQQDTTGVGQSETVGVGASSSRKTTNIWEWYTRYEENGKKRASCHCLKTYAADPKRDGTNNLNKHLKICPKAQNNDIAQMIITQDLNTRSRQIDHKTCREMVVRDMVRHNLPFSFVEYAVIQEYLTYLNPDVKHMSRNTAKATVLKMYEKEKESLKEQLQKVRGRICLTSDLWTSITGDGYGTVTVHYVDNHWKLRSHIIAFTHFPPPHTGNVLSENMISCLKEWGIEMKVFSLTLDNASSNDVMQQSIKRHMNLHKFLILDRKHFHVRCCVHILNLIVQEGLKVIDGALKKIRESVRYVKSSEGRRVSFQECVEKMRINVTMGLRTDVPTRWNSTFSMLESALLYRKAFEQLDCIYSSYNCIPSDEEWDRAGRIASFFIPFDVITRLFLGREYATSNLYFLNVWRIQAKLNVEVNSLDMIISNMAMEMKEKFDKYWEEYTCVLAFAMILDPRYKMDFVSYCYNKLDCSPSKEYAKGKLAHIKKELYELFHVYVKLVPRQNLKSTRAPQGIVLAQRPIAELNNLEEDWDTVYVKSSGSKSELDSYLGDALLDRQEYLELEMLSFWKDQKKRYPMLSTMARDIMSIHITTVASESAFSMESRLLTKYRSSILPSNVEALICLQNWMCGYEVEVEPVKHLEVKDGNQELEVDLDVSNSNSLN